MRISEINKIFENKYFFTDIDSVLVLENYTDPETELEVDFRSAAESRTHFYGTVREKSTSNPLVEVVFSLNNKTSELDIGNIIPINSGGKLVHTSVGTQYNGVDIGNIGIRWILKKIKEFALTRGFVIKKISSITRYTGARAKNNQGTDELGMPRSFDINKTVKECIVYDCINESFVLIG